MKRFLLSGLIVIAMCTIQQKGLSQHSVAREWNEMLLTSIRGDFARPTVHARNLFHISSAMYDAWAAYDTLSENYLLGKTLHGYTLFLPKICMPHIKQMFNLCFFMYNL